MMSKRRFFFGSIVCLLTALLASLALSQTRRSRQPASRPDSRRSQQLTLEERKKEFEEQSARRRASMEQWAAERQKEFEERAKDRANGKDARRNEFIKQAFEMTEEQWRVAEPKINRIYFLRDQSEIKIPIGGGGGGGGASYSGGSASSSGGAASNSGRSSGGVSTGTHTAGGYRTQSSSGGGSSGGGSSGGGSGGGGIVSGWSGPIWRLADRELTEGEKICERLLVLLEDKNSKDEQLKQEVAALRRARENAAKELAEASQELDKMLTSRQQARSVLMGLLN